ncbi:AbiH family protein [Saccharicrinis aurantiacus]|uniref:AbiH family protein n=1 Tax=Saccharicrinis aurantiacus TaxID=1849719 RepID=UPI0009502F3B|nr:AbiH family protein [Saccharicrinis aurantiacus]
MRNIFIIGNGFDLAHGLKTSYGDFLDDLEKKITGKPKDFLDIIVLKRTSGYKISFMERINAMFKNKFLEILFRNKEHPNWSDVEYLYYKMLNQYNNREQNEKDFGRAFSYSTSKDLNKDFEVVQKYLQAYLLEQQKEIKLIDGYQQLFNNYDNKSKGTLVLNFNYTNTVSMYLNNCEHIELINIHGELENPDNPIIFGYAASEQESKELLDKNDTELLLNIKRYNYHLTDNEYKLNQFLDRRLSPLMVNILGHSCGVSDRLILSEIFNNENVSGIRQYYYNGHAGYKTTAINIARIIDDYSKTDPSVHKFIKLKTYPQSHPILQCEDMYDRSIIDFDKTNKDFVKYCESTEKVDRIPVKTGTRSIRMRNN